MKKEIIYQIVKKEGKLCVVEAQGYLYRIIDSNAATTVGLEYVRPYWYATHYDSGLACTPYSDKGGYKREWKKKEALLEALKDVPLEQIAAQPGVQKFTQMVNAYKETKK